jgi:hypothetical protein
MGHSAIQTTMRYVHCRGRGREAELLAEAFRVQPDLCSPESWWHTAARPYLSADARAAHASMPSSR